MASPNFSDTAHGSNKLNHQACVYSQLRIQPSDGLLLPKIALGLFVVRTRAFDAANQGWPSCMGDFDSGLVHHQCGIGTYPAHTQYLNPDLYAQTSAPPK